MRLGRTIHEDAFFPLLLTCIRNHSNSKWNRGHLIWYLRRRRRHQVRVIRPGPASSASSMNKSWRRSIAVAGSLKSSQSMLAAWSPQILMTKTMPLAIAILICVTKSDLLLVTEVPSDGVKLTATLVFWMTWSSFEHRCNEFITWGCDLVDNSDLGTGVDSLASRKIGHLLGRNLSHSCQSHRDLAKQLSHYLYFFSFYFLLDLLHKEEVQESVTSQVSQYHSHMTGCHSVTSYDQVT